MSWAWYMRIKDVIPHTLPIFAPSSDEMAAYGDLAELEAIAGGIHGVPFAAVLLGDAWRTAEARLIEAALRS